ncbi:SDR family oxidoreductase [Noviherbaspirillum sp. CPCC 100848]|uniref:SDR family oxidoreductase n=1 Tax=Noviherbaspirillum album TaxID=3080276 RepID=A0ABU6JIH9_9BURK|nr:SDR family oxidoreductase [Noviherbaspirillum sp. CPCC 100848]MEC4723469.1 SDR family oxidoreductase [Noviherbaspirillum sp. CPCC 100848]
MMEPAKGWALVTGAGAGIGRAIADRLAADGFSLLTIDRQEPARPHTNEIFVQADLADQGETAQALETLIGSRDIAVLVNNVGTVRPAAIEDTTLADLNAVVALNLGCALQCTQAVLPRMRQAHYGRIVNISSRAALGKELRTAYAATKAGLHGMTRTWALELAPHGITVNAVGPGPIGTELFHAVNPAGSPRTKAIINGVPVARLGTPDDVAHAVSFFSDVRAGFITGQVLYVCGGMTVGLGPQ